MSALPRDSEIYVPPDAALEANHRIANNLMALSGLFSQRVDEIEGGPATVPREALIELIREMAGRMSALGRLHHLLSSSERRGEVDLGELLSEVIEGYRSTGMFGERLNVRIAGGGQRVDAARASMLMLVMAEIATNAVKYAHPSGIPVELTIAAAATPSRGLMLHIADDGVGLPDGFEEKRDRGSGLRLVRGLVESAGGRLTLGSDPLGLRFAIELPAGGRDS